MCDIGPGMWIQCIDAEGHPWLVKDAVYYVEDLYPCPKPTLWSVPVCQYTGLPAGSACGDHIVITPRPARNNQFKMAQCPLRFKPLNYDPNAEAKQAMKKKAKDHV